MLTNQDAHSGEEPHARIVPTPSSANVAILALTFVLFLQCTLVFTRSINWDEFWFYHLVVAHTRAEMTMPLQTLHVRLFAWLPHLGGSGIDHIVTARILMFICELGTVSAIIVICRRFVDLPTSVLAALLYVSAGFVFQHGTSFRTDPMATAGMMISLAVLARRRLDIVAIATMALLIAVSAMITVKIILYLPAFLGLAWMRFSEAESKSAIVAQFAATAVLTGTMAVGLYLWHTANLGTGAAPTSAASRSSTAAGGAMLEGAANWIFFIGVPPYLNLIIKAALTAPLLSIATLASPFFIAISRRPMPEKLAIAGFWLIALVPLFYKNTAAYFYVFMFAPLAVGCLEALKVIVSRYGILLPAMLLVGIGVSTFALENRRVIHNQREIERAAELLFPEPVYYFDHNGMLPSFVKANYLMTPSAMAAYREQGIPTMRNAMVEHPVPLLLLNWFSLSMTMTEGDNSLFLPQDLKALRENYVGFYGPFWLAGREVKAGGTIKSEILVPGPYTVMDGNLVIDGQNYLRGSNVILNRGWHSFTAPEADARVIWGVNRTEPVKPWLEAPQYVGF